MIGAIIIAIQLAFGSIITNQIAISIFSSLGWKDTTVVTDHPLWLLSIAGKNFYFFFLFFLNLFKSIWIYDLVHFFRTFTLLPLTILCIYSSAYAGFFTNYYLKTALSPEVGVLVGSFVIGVFCRIYSLLSGHTFSLIFIFIFFFLNYFFF
jgi:hypothetical protein